jgi:signal transduction histidine kinase
MVLRTRYILQKLKSGLDEIARSRMLASTALGTALLLAIGIAATAMMLRNSSADRAVTHTFEVREAAARLLTNLVDAQAGVRGYVITGQESFLEPYRASSKAISGNIASLRAKISDNPHQEAKLNEIEQGLGSEFTRLSYLVSLTRTGRQPDAVDSIKSGDGKKLTDTLREKLAAFSAEEGRLLNLRQEWSDLLEHWLLLCIIAGLIGSGALSFFFIRSLRSYIAQIQAKNAALEAESHLRRMTEDSLRQAQKMEAIGQLTGGIAHDFNNLLTIIIGNLDTLKRRMRDMEGAHAATLGRPIEAAMKGASNAARLTHRLLAFSRQQALEPATLDLNSTVAGMSDLLRRTVGETVDIETVLGGGLWKTFADANQLESVLLNLVVNARDALPKGGHITIETANAFLDDAYAARFGDTKAGQYVLLSITDNGVGIPAAVMDRVFEPFFTTKGAETGTGLGLAMVHGFVKQTGGHVRIYSEEGQGTTVKIYLPRLTAAQEIRAVPPAAELTEPARAREGDSILVVEDNHYVRDYAVSVLKDLGYRVFEAADAAAALSLLTDERKIDLLFTDIVLPGPANGRQLAEQIVRLRGSIQVLFTTGFTRNAIVHHGQLDADVHLLHKPYTQQELARKIRELLDRSNAR